MAQHTVCLWLVLIFMYLINLSAVSVHVAGAARSLTTDIGHISSPNDLPTISASSPVVSPPIQHQISISPQELVVINGGNGLKRVDQRPWYKRPIVWLWILVIAVALLTLAGFLIMWKTMKIDNSQTLVFNSATVSSGVTVLLSFLSHPLSLLAFSFSSLVYT